MPIGISTLCTFGETFAKISRYREFTPSVIEILDDWLDWLDGSRIALLSSLASEWDVLYTIHSPIIDINLASLNAEVRDLSIRRVKESIAHAHKLGASLVVIHPGVSSGLDKVAPDTHWRLNYDSLSKILEYAEREGVRICLENMPAGERLLFKTPEEFLCLSEEGLTIGMALDVGHANTVGLLPEFLDKLRGRIVHLHLHDNMGTNDEHLVVGKGTVDWGLVRKRVDLCRITGVVECHTLKDAAESLSASRHAFRS
ncbi:MAG: sugar phosphate isomerase/epimerase family protein [Candidatus Verstraetearchaeota archaeon]|nr:sugar phosphate isomerase/epimerase family protein [Candidatus Verstraetearchaeota archaeon]